MPPRRGLSRAMATNPGSYQANGRSGSEGSGKGRFGGEAFGQVTAYMREKKLDAFEIAAYAFLTIRAAEQEKTPLNEVKASPQDISGDIRGAGLQRPRHSTALSARASSNCLKVERARRRDGS